MECVTRNAMLSSAGSCSFDMSPAVTTTTLCSATASVAAVVGAGAGAADADLRE